MKLFVFILSICVAMATTSFAQEGVKDPDKIQKTQTVYSPEGQLSAGSCLIGGKAYIKVISGISMMDVASLWTDMRYFENEAHIKEINILIMSPGGDGYAGLAMADEISRVVKKGIVVKAYASGLIASAAVPVFMSASERIAAPGTVFMVHEPQLFKFLSSEKRSDLTEQQKMMDMMVDRYITILAAHSKLSRQEWEKMGKDTTWFTVDQAIKWGVVDKVE